ncbi:MAG: DUF6288 domain-containing protein [Verrucomicrobiales bacterium]
MGFTVFLPLVEAAGGRKEPSVPDFTQGDPIGERHDWNLGPTGARGWMWGWNLQTTKARQIFVTEVAKGSPADGVLEEGDVILGVGGQVFQEDARHAFGRAIGEAEAKDGKLVLRVWKDGETRTSTIELPVLGAYRDTAPFDCGKSQRICDAAADHVAARLEAEWESVRESSWEKPEGGAVYSSKEITNAVDALALLAVGKPEHAELVAKYARSFAPADLKLVMGPTTRMPAWGWSYANVFLCEYHLATGDESVLPAIEKYTTAIAKGQSFIGSWGHSMAWPELNNGEWHGSLMGYGALNSAGLICQLALVLGEKCGVENEEVSTAIAKANKFFGFYSDKGAIPYGDHFPGWDRHDDNGKNSMAAVLFDLQGMEKHSRFFTHMTVASYGERERGHTGNYFSFLWGPLGTQRAGNEATAAFLAEQRWFYDMNRAWDGSFPYQGGANSGQGEHSYAGWDSTGAFLLTYALPQKRLFVTGKGSRKENLLVGEELEEVLEAGSGFSCWDNGVGAFEAKEIAQIVEDLKSWSPAVRFRAAEALALKPGAEKVVPTLIAMLDSETLASRYGACQALGALKELAAPAVESLRGLLMADDTWLRIQAVSALANIGEASRAAVPELMQLVMKEDEGDPLEITQRYLALGLFNQSRIQGGRGLLADSVEGVDRETLYKVVQKILKNPDGRTRGAVNAVYQSLSYEEIQPLLPAIVEAIETPSPSGVMFASQVRLYGVELLAKYKVREGMELCLQILELDKWGKNKRIQKSLEILAEYGGAAKEVLPELRQLEKDLRAHPEARMLKPRVEQVRGLIRDIEEAKSAPELRDLY